jgi:hypothetical protein
MIRNIYLKFEVDTLRNEKVIVKNILLHQNLNTDAWACRTALQILRIVELKRVHLLVMTNHYVKQEPVEPGDAPRLGFGHRKVYLL